MMVKHVLYPMAQISQTPGQKPLTLAEIRKHSAARGRSGLGLPAIAACAGGMAELSPTRTMLRPQL